MRPGELAKEYAKRMNWTLRPRNVMVEGESDVSYFIVANELYKENEKLDLLGNDISLFACGTGDSGGTVGMFEQLPPLLKIIRSDPDPTGKILFRVVALIDNDHAGRGLKNGLIQQYREIKTNRDIFILNRVFPRTTSEPRALTSQIEKYNISWKGLDCEIEDLIGPGIIECFLEENLDALRKPPIKIDNGYHYEWNESAKPNLCRFTQRYALLDDVSMIIEVLKSLRFYLGLPPAGI
jgi:hypothetical protein